MPRGIKTPRVILGHVAAAKPFIVADIVDLEMSGQMVVFTIIEVAIQTWGSPFMRVL